MNFDKYFRSKKAMKEACNLLLIILCIVYSLVFFSDANLAQAKNSSEKMKINVSAKANTGGNTVSGGGNIETGDAKAEARSEIYSNGDKTEMSASAKAEANGKTAEIQSDEPGNLEAVADQNGTCVAKGNETCPDKIGDNGGQGSQSDYRDKDINNGNNIDKFLSAISDLSENILEKIKNCFT
jgi:hypothetical protein